MNFTLSIPEEHLKLIRAEAGRLGIPIASYLKIKAIEGISNKSEVIIEK